jgi:hypothetical protein
MTTTVLVHETAVGGCMDHLACSWFVLAISGRVPIADDGPPCCFVMAVLYIPAKGLSLLYFQVQTVIAAVDIERW